MVKQSYISDLYSLNQQVVSRELKTRIKSTDDADVDFENRLWQVVYKLQPREITVGRDPIISWKDFPYHPDLFAVFDSFILISEARYTSSTTFLLQGLSKLEEAKSALNSLVRQEFENKKLLLLFAIKDKRDLNDTIQKRANSSGIRIIDEREIDYYLKLSKDAGIGIFYQFFSMIAPSLLAVDNKDVLAIKVKEGRRTKYIFSINPQELLERAFVSHRELNSPEQSLIGYQRMLRKKKLKEISEYIKVNGGFPSPIIVSVKGEVFDPLPKDKRREQHEDIEFGTLHLPAKPRTIYVVDGQHRLYGYTLLERNTKYYINVIAYKGLRGADEGTMFVDINLKQTKVPSQLLWELYPDILSPLEEDYHKAVISRAVEDLATSQNGKGKIEHISSGAKGSISFPTLCSEIERVGLVTKGGAGIVGGIVGNDWEDQAKKLTTILGAFFDTIESFEDSHHDVNKRFFLQNTGIVPLVRILGKICKELQSEQPSTLKSGRQRIADAIKPYLNILYEHYAKKRPDELDKLKKRVGGSGFNETEDEMDDLIRKVHTSFPLRNKRVPDDLKKAVNAFVSAVVEINRKSLDHSTQWIFRDFDKDKILKQLQKPAKSTVALENFVILVYQEIIEGSGNRSQKNPLFGILNVTDLNDIAVVRKLTYLRHKYAHRDTQIEAYKRTEALDFIRELVNEPSLSHFDNLDSDQCRIAQVALLDTLREKLLVEILKNLGA